MPPKKKRTKNNPLKGLVGIEIKGPIKLVENTKEPTNDAERMMRKAAERIIQAQQAAQAKPEIVKKEVAKASIPPLVKSPLLDNAEVLTKLYDYLNKKLLNSTLGDCMLLWTRNREYIGGYYSPRKWSDANKDVIIDEIGINVNIMQSGDMVEIGSILLHEMFHKFQQDHGTPGVVGYHNEEYARLMGNAGIVIKSLDKGKEGESTGYMMVNEIQDDGDFMRVITEMPPDLLPRWFADPFEVDPADPNGGDGGGGGQGKWKNKGDWVPPRGGGGKSGTRYKYTCPLCGLNVWAKWGAKVMCLECSEVMLTPVTGGGEESD